MAGFKNQTFTEIRYVRPAGQGPDAEVVLVESILIDTETGDRLFWRSTPGGTSCTDPATGVVTYTVPGEFTGGTGRFEGASGTLTSTGSAHVRAIGSPDGPDGLRLRRCSGTIEGALHLAR